MLDQAVIPTITDSEVQSAPQVSWWPRVAFYALLLLAVLVMFGLPPSPLWATVPGGGESSSTSSEKNAETTEGSHSAHPEPNAMAHVLDSPIWEGFQSFGQPHWDLPKIGNFQITKFMILEVIAAALIIVIYVPLAQRLKVGVPATGARENAFEVLLTFVREEVAKPSIGEHNADKYVPFLWTMFLFILFNNLLGMVPFGGSATASVFVNLGLAICVFFAIHGSAVAKMGFLHYVKSMWPHIDLHGIFGLVIKGLVFVIEVFGVLVKNLVLAIRLFANMFAGHMVLATILIFIYMAKDQNPFLWGAITATSVLGMIALSLLEIFVAFLQAYIFVFLTALFMGMAQNPEH